MRDDKPNNPVVEKSFDFALSVIEFCESLKEVGKYELGKQLFRSGTSIGANIREAQNAESKADFIHKFKIALKECDETIYWLQLCLKAQPYPNPPNSMITKAEELLKIMSKIVSTSKKNQ